MMIDARLLVIEAIMREKPEYVDDKMTEAEISAAMRRVINWLNWRGYYRSVEWNSQNQLSQSTTN